MNYDDEYVRYYDHIYPETTIVFKGKVNFTTEQIKCLKEIVEEALYNSIDGIDGIDDEDIEDSTTEVGLTDDGQDSYFYYSCEIKVYTEDKYAVHRYEEWHSEVHAAEHFVEVDEADDANFDKARYEKHVRDCIKICSEKGELPELEVNEIDSPYINIEWSEIDD